MLDIKFIREHPEKLKQSLKNRGVDFNVDGLLELDAKRRETIGKVGRLRAEHNKLSTSEEYDKIARSGGGIPRLRHLKEQVFGRGVLLKQLEEEFEEQLRRIPNLPLDNVPVGKDERENKVIREVGKKPKFGFQARDYMEIGAALKLIDTKRAAKVSGSRFGYLKGVTARLEIALVQFAFEHLIKNGFVPVIPPVLIKEEIMQGVGYIDSREDQEERYHLEKDKLYLVGTSEQSIGPMHKDEIFQEKELPQRYVAFSTCFRREAGSYGKDTHGILRVHQFDKVEMFSFTKPDDSKKEHKFLLAMEEELVQALNIPYRVVALCTGDLSQPSAATYDIESWLPGQDEGKGQYRETHSTSNTTDFQARRLNIRYKPRAESRESRVDFVHMLNGTAFAIGRTIIAILENYQQEDGSVKIPEVLQKYMGGLKVIE